jgi:hypothetical protein
MSQVSSANRGSPDCTICDYGTARRPGPWASIFAVQTDVENKRVGLVSQVRSQNGNLAIESNEPVNTTGTEFSFARP